MAKDGYYLVVPLTLIAVLFFYLEWRVPAIFCLALALFMAYFFRDPERVIPTESARIVSPADGRVVEILPAAHSASGQTQIAIFLSPLDVHINRSPIAGRVESSEYKPGKFMAAFKPSASIENEQNVITINNGQYKVVVKQIAGVLARRIVCWKRSGDTVAQGERIGLIKFGSRVEMLLPATVEVAVQVGDRIKGGSSIIGKYHENTR
ncbi:MAG: phosphatidylserine decarboxylase family protein [Acidobacteria bacterium]|nr:phosphatidylserine decarboxylase family protein [Acidobacteriota bacterium]MBI3657119.1 phosphatidylserine decarboxylase family protein [Acidobacteriota bacterium]